MKNTILVSSPLWSISQSYTARVYLLHFDGALCHFWAENVARWLLHVAGRCTGRTGRGAVRLEETRGRGIYKTLTVH